jgi:predicted GNAT superfamily acetyltransferase
MRIRELTAADLPEALRLNNANVPAVSPSDEVGFARLIELSALALGAVEEQQSADGAAETLLGYVILMSPGTDYPSENYRWFEARGTNFLYVDRILVQDEAQNRGVGAALYAAVFAAAAAKGATEVTCEVNVDPPNPGSLRFHARLGFTEVGRQATKGDTIVVSLLAAPLSR